MSLVQKLGGAAFAMTLGAVWPASASADEISLDEIVRLQAAMQSHIDSRLVDGAYLRVDTSDGAIKRYYYVGAHSGIIKDGDIYALCANVQTSVGKKANFDFFISNRNPGYVVFKLTIDTPECL